MEDRDWLKEIPEGDKQFLVVSGRIDYIYSSQICQRDNIRVQYKSVC